MKRSARVLVLLLGIVGLTGTMVPPATANTLKTITFVGQATLDCGLGYFFAGPNGFDPTTKTPNLIPTVKTGPKAEPQFNLDPNQGNHCNFVFTSTACVKTSVGKKMGAADLCAITAFGTVWGFCGWWTAVGVATIVNLSGGKESITTTFKATDALGITISGGNITTNIYGTALALPTVGSCTNKSATGFTIAGELVYKACTNGTTGGVCNP